MASRNDLKTWFASLKKPTGAQFAALIDTFFSKAEDTLSVADIDGLAALIAGKASAADVAALVAQLTAINGVDSNLQSQITALSNALIAHPTYTAATVPLSSSQTTGGLEIGQTISIPLIIGYNQNDSGAKGAVSLKKDGTEIATGNYTDTGVVITATAKVYQAAVSYAQGAVKNNVLGIPDATGRIGAGSAISNMLSYAGVYRLYYGPGAADPSDRVSALALGQSQLSNAGNTFILNTGNTYLNQYLLVPSNKSFVSAIDLDASNNPVAYLLISSAVTVNDAGGNAVAGYKLYKRTQGTVYSANHRHQITIA